MKLNKTQTGFTVIEVMITMAVTMAIFIGTVFLVSGQVQRAQFRAGSNSLEQQFRDVLNDARDGFFGNNTVSTTACTVAGYDGNGRSECVYAGVKFVVDIDEKTLIKYSLYCTSGSGYCGARPNNVTQVDQTGEVINSLPGTFDYKLLEDTNTPPTAYSDNQYSWYVLFNVYPTLADPSAPATNNQFGTAQSLSLYVEDAAGNLVTPSGDQVYLCGVAAGNRNAKFIVGENGAMTVAVQYNTQECSG